MRLTESSSVRMLLVESDRAVCVGGKWDGWLFWLHPNGSWISARKLPETEPMIDPVFSQTVLGQAALAQSEDASRKRSE